MRDWNVLAVSTAYMWVLLAVACQILYYAMLPFLGSTANRYELIPDPVLEQFAAEHEAHTGTPGSRPPTGGHPDMGSGRYTMAAGYKSWMGMQLG